MGFFIFFLTLHKSGIVSELFVFNISNSTVCDLRISIQLGLPSGINIFGGHFNEHTTTIGVKSCFGSYCIFSDEKNHPHGSPPTCHQVVVVAAKAFNVLPRGIKRTSAIIKDVSPLTSWNNRRGFGAAAAGRRGSDVVCVECAVRVLCVHSRLKKANRSVTQVDASAEQFSNQEPVNYPQTFEHKLPSNCSNFNAKCITLEWAYLNQSVV